MLLRSSSTPFPLPFLSSSLHLRRAFSDAHLPSLHPPSSTPNDAGRTSNPGRGGLHTELSFSVYNTFGKGEAVLAPLASPPRSQGQEGGRQPPPTVVVQPEHPEVPLFLARGLGIDRIASGFFTAGADLKGCGASMEEQQDEAVAALDAQYKTMVDEQPGNALFLRNYAQFLHEVYIHSFLFYFFCKERWPRMFLLDSTDAFAAPAALPAGEGRHRKGRGVLLARHARGSQRRRDHVAVRQAGLGGAPRPGEVPRLLPAVGAGGPVGQVTTSLPESRSSTPRMHEHS